MPCLFRRNNGIFYFVFMQNGKRTWRSTLTRSLEEAHKQFDDFQDAWETKHRSTVSSFFSQFLQTAHLSYSGRTIQLYSQAFSNFTRIVGDKRLDQLAPLDLEEFKRKRSMEVRPVSVNIELKTLRAAFGDAKRLKFIKGNPCDGVKPVRVLFREAAYLSEKEFFRLLEVIEDPEFRNLVKFAAFTMMRRGEIINLRWADLDLAKKLIRIRSNGEFRVKGGKPRVVPMNDWVYTFLSSRPRRGEYVFLGRSGQQLIGGPLSRRFKRYVRKAGLSEDVHFHSLRHTGISWLINRGVPSEFVRRIAGHSSLLVTQIYTHVEDQNLINAINAFGPVTAN